METPVLPTDMKTALMILLAVCALLAVLCIYMTASRSSARKRRRKSPVGAGTVAFAYISAAAVLAVFLFCAGIYRDALTGEQSAVRTPSANRKKWLKHLKPSTPRAR